MPSGVPVATVAIGGAKNAAYLAVQILALSDGRLAEALTKHKQEMAESVKAKDLKLQG
jgi:5-(carboxyamino)imidazole ribonucleotide mutase